MTTSKTWKHAEREFARTLQKAAGKVEDPALAALVTDTGRVGHLYQLQFDFLAGNGAWGLLGEAKRHKIPAWLVTALVLVVNKARQFKRRAVLGFQLPEPKIILDEETQTKQRMVRDWAMIPWDDFIEYVIAWRFLHEQTGPIADQWLERQIEEGLLE